MITFHFLCYQVVDVLLKKFSSTMRNVNASRKTNIVQVVDFVSFMFCFFCTMHFAAYSDLGALFNSWRTTAVIMKLIVGGN